MAFPNESPPDNTADKIRLLMKLRRAGIVDTRVLSAMEQTPRELFVAAPFRDKAYDDTPLPIESGQTISQPSIVAWMTWTLDISDRHRVLEIGTGSGYQTSILARLCRRVYTIEMHKNLSAEALRRFELMKLRNITHKVGDGRKGWPEAAPFERIIVTAAAREVPPALLEQLAVGGVMVLPVGDEAGEQMLLRVDKTETGIQTRHLMHVRFVPLQG